jgi:hypothetical protein
MADLVLKAALNALCECQNQATDYGNAQQFTELPAYLRRSRRS